MRYQVFLEEPSLDAHRLGYSPRDGYATILVGIWAVLTGESGATYNLMRGLPLPDTCTALNFGAYVGNGVLDEHPELAFSFTDHPVLENFAEEQAKDAVVYAGPSFRLEIGLDRYRWTDAKGKVELEARTLGKPCTFFVPAQGDFEYPIMARSHLAKVTGTFDGDPVEGVLNLDHYYSTPGVNFRELGVTAKLHNYWMNWLVEYEDGDLEGGFAWRGMPRTGFGAAHHFVDGKSVARSDARIAVERTELGSMKKVTLRLGDDVTVEFGQHGSFDWPLHTYGTVSTISRHRKVAKSWNYSENFPLNWGVIAEYQEAHAALYGRYPSLQGLFKGARVVDGNIVPA